MKAKPHTMQLLRVIKTNNGSCYKRKRECMDAVASLNLTNWRKFPVRFVRFGNPKLHFGVMATVERHEQKFEANKTFRKKLFSEPQNIVRKILYNTLGRKFQFYTSRLEHNKGNLPWVPHQELELVLALGEVWKARCTTPCLGKKGLASLELMVERPIMRFQDV